MATNFNENSIVSSGGFKPSSKDTPLDIRTRVETEQDIYEIPNPYIGMIVYVKDTGKRFEILTLKEVDTGLTTKNVVDTYKQFTVDLEEYAKIEDVPTKVSELENDKGYLVNQDISGKADVEDIPTKVSELENDRGYATERFVDSKIETINSEIDGIDSNITNLNTEIDNINTDLIGVSESVEGSWISVDSKEGYLKDIEILGNTIQNQNDLADIRSVGDKLENQELYEIPVLITGKKLFDVEIVFKSNVSTYVSQSVKLKAGVPYVLSKKQKGISIRTAVFYSDGSSALDGYLYANDVFTPIKDDTYTFKFSRNSTYLDQEGVYNMQLEEGTVATEYEPYQEHKLTILSPVQLEKVGDIADRIICKDGVWGVEKNIDTIIFSGAEKWETQNINTTPNAECKILLNTLYTSDIATNNKGVSNLNVTAVYSSNKNIGICYIYNTKSFRIRLNEDGSTGDEVSSYLASNPTFFKYVLAQPQFIPLPHDQQIKLRTFANKINIHFGCEIEPTLKASVPKSIGVTVNSHTEQIDNLSKELDRVKKLEESTTSTVTTESNFTTVENTNNGYFDDVKIEGKTLVNLNDIPTRWIVNSIGTIAYLRGEANKHLLSLKPDTIYTVILYGRNYKFNNDFMITNVMNNNIKLSNDIGVFKSKTDIENSLAKDPHVYGRNLKAQDLENVKLLILEGDHTQNPPEFFEGLKSVGQDVDDITISTTNAPMFFGKGGKK